MKFQSDMNPQEEKQLDLLADELRQAVPDSPLSADFDNRLQARLAAQPWTLRSALQSNRLLRVAAALLFVTTVVGPVSALVLMFVRPEFVPTELVWLLGNPSQESVSVHEPVFEPVIPPADPSLEEAFGLPWHKAVERSNRMALAILQWNRAYSSSEFPVPVQTPALMDWSQATEKDIKDEFERRCLLNLHSPPPASLAERIKTLQNRGDVPPWLQAWRWVLEGSGLEPAEFFIR
jgi:hypothetical protein